MDGCKDSISCPCWYGACRERSHLRLQMPYLAWTNGARRELCSSLLNLLLTQHQQEFKQATSHTSATCEAPFLSPHSHYPAKAPGWPDTEIPKASKGSQLTEGSTGAFDIPPAPGKHKALLVWDGMTKLI